MIVLIENFIVIVVFTLLVWMMSKNPLDVIYNYPPAIIHRVQELGLIPEGEKKKTVVKKVFAVIVFGILLGLIVRHINGIDSFWKGAGVTYLLLLVADWWDAFVLDCLWFCHDKHFVIPGTEDMVSDYHDYWFHIRGSLIGMVIVIPSALIAGLICII